MFTAVFSVFFPLCVDSNLLNADKIFDYVRIKKFSFLLSNVVPEVILIIIQPWSRSWKSNPKRALHNNRVLPDVFLMPHKLNCRIRNCSRKFCGYFTIRKFHSVGCHEQANTNMLDSSRCVYVVSSVSCKGDQYYVSEDRMQSLARINR